MDKKLLPLPSYRSVTSLEEMYLSEFSFSGSVNFFNSFRSKFFNVLKKRFLILFCVLNISTRTCLGWPSIWNSTSTRTHRKSEKCSGFPSSTTRQIWGWGWACCGTWSKGRVTCCGTRVRFYWIRLKSSFWRFISTGCTPVSSWRGWASVNLP